MVKKHYYCFQICYDGLCVDGSVCKRGEDENSGRFLCLHPNTCQDYACVSDVADDYIDEDEDKEFAFRGGGLAPVVEHLPVGTLKQESKTVVNPTRLHCTYKQFLF